MSPKTRREHIKKALGAQYILLAYNLAEAVFSLFFGLAASSIALISFGLDSLIESLSTVIVTWRLRKSGSPKEEEYEHTAFRLVGYCFIILAVYVTIESLRKLVVQEVPEASLPGIVIAILSIVVMPIMARYRHDLGHAIGSNSLVADSKQTMLCTYMSVALLVGIGLNFLFGLWWADPLAGLVIAGLALQEGKRILEGKVCC